MKTNNSPVQPDRCQTVIRADCEKTVPCRRVCINLLVLT